MENRQLKAGCLAFFDSFAGLVSCKVTSVRSRNPQNTRPSTDHAASFVVTADRGPYRKGETLESSSLWVVPRGAIRRGQFSSGIGFYTVHADALPQP